MRLGKVWAWRAIRINDALRQKVQYALIVVFGFIRGKKVIEAAVLANDNDDMFDGCSGLDGIDCSIRIGLSLGLGRRPKAERQGQNGRASNGLRSPCSCITAMHGFLRALESTSQKV